MQLYAHINQVENKSKSLAESASNEAFPQKCQELDRKGEEVLDGLALVNLCEVLP